MGSAGKDGKSGKGWDGSVVTLRWVRARPIANELMGIAIELMGSGVPGWGAWLCVQIRPGCARPGGVLTMSVLHQFGCGEQLGVVSTSAARCPCQGSCQGQSASYASDSIEFGFRHDPSEETQGGTRDWLWPRLAQGQVRPAVAQEDRKGGGQWHCPWRCKPPLAGSLASSV